MDSSIPSDEQNLNDTRLEVEFRQILCIIKNSILHVNSSRNLSFYRAWLEKLNSLCVDKYLRNSYLIRLARQVQGNSLAYPFNQYPPSGPLEWIEDPYCEDSDVPVDNSSCGDDICCEEPERLMQMFEGSIVKDSPYESNTEVLLSCAKGVKDDQQYSQDYSGILETTIATKELSSEQLDKKTQIKKRKLKPNNYKPYDIIFKEEEDCPNPVKEPVKDATKGTLGNIQADSSWYDLTDTSLTSILNPLGSGDAVRKAKVRESIANFNDVQPKVDTSQNNNSEFLNFYEGNNHQEKKEIKENKFPLKDTHYISTDWKKTIESLQLRLTETLTQNNELKLTIEKLSAQILLEAKKREQNDCHLKQLRNSHIKEIEALKKTQEENLMKLEISFQIKFEEAQKSYNEQLENLAGSYEQKIRNLKADSDNVKVEKDQEIFRLSEIIQQQCSRISQEIKALREQLETNSGKNHSEEKIYTLQRCVSKMDKLFHKSEKDYVRQVEKLKQELERKDKIAKIQLKSQKAELIARTSEEKQRQFDELVNNLEVKYIKMLEYHEREVLENKQEDDDKIDYLKHLLDRYDIPYNIS